MATLSLQNPEITLKFSPSELQQLEAIATLHGVSVTAFVQRAALEAAHIGAPPNNAPSDDALWLSETWRQNPQKETLADLFAPEEPKVQPQTVPPFVAPKRGVAGEASSLAKGQGPVWEIRRALGQQRVHGLGWTREHLAFVLKLSVVGVRKMEHLGTAPIKSPEARRNLLELARLLENPSPAIVDYIHAEAAALV